MQIFVLQNIKHLNTTPIYPVLDKDIIEMEIVAHIPLPKRGFAPTVPLVELVNAILYKLKTGVEWEFLPTQLLFSDKVLSYKTVLGHYRNRCEAGVWKDAWIHLLCKYKAQLDLSSADLDGSHTPAQKGGEKVAYQRRKRHKTTNTLYLTERTGLPLAM